MVQHAFQGVAQILRCIYCIGKGTANTRKRGTIFEEFRTAFNVVAAIKAFRKSRGTERGEQSSPQIQVSPQQSTVTQSSGPPVSVTTNPQVTGP
jgi:hypothetical protein